MWATEEEGALCLRAGWAESVLSIREVLKQGGNFKVASWASCEDIFFFFFFCANQCLYKSALQCVSVDLE